MDKKENISFINEFWDQNILPTLMEYIYIPNKSPAFDKDWLTSGHMDKAVKLIANWCQKHALKNMTLDVIQLENKTPLIFIDIPLQDGSSASSSEQSDECILLYGHLDKQPEMTGWDKYLHPWKPVLRGERLYGRGAADDGYAVFSSLAAIKSLQQQQIPHARCVILIESCEESGSIDLPFYIEHLKDRLGNPSLVICLDSGCGNYDQLWVTTSLRGGLDGFLSIDVLKNGMHSGMGSGIVPSAFRILRQLLNRIEDIKTGDVLLKEVEATIPTERQQQIQKTANALSKTFVNDFPFITGVQPEASSISELIMRNTWKAALSVVGCDGFPPTANAGNVTLPNITVKLSLRLPPTCDHQKALAAFKKTLEDNPPYQARIQFNMPESRPGWNAPLSEPWLVSSLNDASKNYFGKEALYMGEGGSIPFMGMLGEKFPQAQFVITGLLGPESNAHGPNEFLHITAAKKLTACIAQVIEDHYNRLK